MHGGPVVWMFPGQGAPLVGMGSELYEQEPVYRRELDACAAVLRPIAGRDLREVIYPAAGASTDAAALLAELKLEASVLPASFMSIFRPYSW